MIDRIREFIHELRIKYAQYRLLHAAQAERQQRGREFIDLIRQRSPEQVARMEREKGLI